MSPHSSSWLSLERLSIVLYLGSVLIMSSAFCAFRYFTTRSKKNSIDLEKKQNLARSDGQSVSRFRSKCRAVLACVGISKPRFRLNKVSKYFVNGKTKETSASSTANDSESTGRKGDWQGRLSKINHLSVDGEFQEKPQLRSHSVNGEEASLTQIVIAQIEHDNNERNRKAIESHGQHQRHSPRDANVKSNLDKHQSDKSAQGTSSERQLIDASAAVTRNKEQEIKCKLSAPLGFIESGQVDEDPIYDVPPSKSLINLNLNSSASIDEEISLQKQHHIQVSHDLAYFHTSSPNIFLSVEQDDAIYDTPSTRSLAI